MKQETFRFEPITYDNFSELQPGEWIWDSKEITRHKHEKSLGTEYIDEPWGFRQIHIVDVDYLKHHMKAFMLTDAWGYYCWEYFETGRYYRIVKEAKSC